MIYAVVQSEFGGIDQTLLAEALQAIGVNHLDAANQADKAKPGFPGFGLSEEEATTLQAFLADHSVKTEMLALPDLVPLPDQQTFNKGYVAEEGFVVFDMYGRDHLIDWDDIQIVATGEVLESQIINTLSAPKNSSIEGTFSAVGRAALNSASMLSVATGGGGIFVTKKSDGSLGGSDTGANVSSELNHMVEIVGTGEFPRIRIKASKFDYSFLEEDMSPNTTDNFLELIALLNEAAPESVYLENNTVALADDDDDCAVISFSSAEKWDAYIFWLLQHV